MASPEAVPNGQQYWRGRVDSKLDHLTIQVKANTDRLELLDAKLDGLSQLLNQGTYVEWRPILSKLGIPLFITLTTFFLLTIIPILATLVILGPQLIEHLTNP